MSKSPLEETINDLGNETSLIEVQDWAAICRGDGMELRRGESLIRRGVVDDLAPDLTMLWIAQNGAEQREIIYREDGNQLWIVSSDAKRPGHLFDPDHRPGSA